MVIVSGDSGKAIVDELLATGASAFLEKPFDFGWKRVRLDQPRRGSQLK